MDPKRQNVVPIERLNRIAWLLDNSIPLPGLNYRIGLDPLIGLFPGIGEAVTALFSIYIIVAGARSGLPAPLVLRMGLNVALDVLIGAIPLVGDIFDMTWKANARNVRLIQQYAAAPQKSVAASALMLAVVLITLVLLIAAVVYVAFLILSALWSAASR